VFGKAVSAAARIGLSKAQLSEKVTAYVDAMRECRFIPASQLVHGDNAALNRSEAVDKLMWQAQELYAYLIGPVEKHLEGLKTLAIVSEGPLRRLPFHALARADSGTDLTFVIEEKRIVYLWNTSFLSLLLDRSKNQVPRVPESIVAFADPDLGDPGLSLRFARSEVESIKNIFPNARDFVGAAATKENFLNAWGQYEIVHIAAHTRLTGNRPFIMLAPADKGALYTDEIENLEDAGRTRFVVLSGCETAVSHARPGTDPISLASVALSFLFSRSQINGVIGTLWPIVDDTQTTDLIKTFYVNLNNRLTPYQALYQAQLEMIEREDIWGQPYYWAPFVVYGSWL
jgi:CHAT domain-containing protein